MRIFSRQIGRLSLRYRHSRLNSGLFLPAAYLLHLSIRIVQSGFSRRTMLQIYLLRWDCNSIRFHTYQAGAVYRLCYRSTTPQTPCALVRFFQVSLHLSFYFLFDFPPYPTHHGDGHTVADCFVARTVRAVGGGLPLCRQSSVKALSDVQGVCLPCTTNSVSLPPCNAPPLAFTVPPTADCL